jgi:hypothetical protein
MSFDKVAGDKKVSRFRWLAWLAIPLPILVTYIDAAAGSHDEVLLAGLIAGWICCGFASPGDRILKWILLVLCPGLIYPLVALLAFLWSRTPMRLF